MFKLSIRNLLAHKGRFVMTAFAVVLGVGFVVGSFVVADTLRGSVTGLFTETSQGIDLTVRAASNLDGGAATTRRGRIPDSLLGTVRAVPGVAAAEGDIQGYAQLLDRSGKPVSTTGAPFLGVSWGRDDRLVPVTLDAGRKPVGPDEVAIDRGTAKDYGLGVGDHTTVLLVGGSRPVTVVGVFTFGRSNSLLGARLTAFDASIASEALGAPGQWDNIVVAAGPGVDRAVLARRIGKVLPAGVEVVSRADVVAENTKGVEGFISVFQTALLGFAGIALFVSAFYINNTFAIVLGQRVRELGLLRALGAGGKQVRRSILIEAFLVGSLASVLGMAAGIGIAYGLQAILAVGGFSLPSNGLVLETRTWIAAVVIGIGVTVLATLLPARRATHIPPVAAMTMGYVSPAGDRRRRLIAGGLVTVVGSMLVVLGLVAAGGTGAVVALLAVGALAVFVGVSLLSPLVAVPAAALLGAPLQRFGGTTGRLARSNAMRSPLRTARTASALMIGLALVTMVFVVGASIKRSFSVAIERSVGADLIVTVDGFTGMSPKVAEGLAALPEIEVASGVRFGTFKVAGRQVGYVAADARSGSRLVDIDVQAGSLADLGDGTLFVRDGVAAQHGWKVGDTVEVQFASGSPERFRIAGLHADATFVGDYFVDLSSVRRLDPANQLDFLAFARIRSGVSPAAATRAADRVLAAYPQTKLQDRSEYRQAQVDRINQLLVAINGLLGLALIIALLGIANTLALSVMERTREIGLLRAVGMSRRQTRRMVLGESLIVSLFGAGLGVALGLVFGLAAVSALPESVVTELSIPVGSLATIVVAAAVCGLLAGVLPARRASRLDVLEAIESR